VQTPFPTAAVVAGAVVFSIFENQVLRIHAFGVVAEMGGVILLFFDAQQLEEGLCNCSRVLFVFDIVILEKPGEVEDYATVIFVVNAKVRSVSRFRWLPTSGVNIQSRVLEEMVLEFLDEVSASFLGEILEWNFSGLVEVYNLKVASFSHFLWSYFFKEFFKKWFF